MGSRAAIAFAGGYQDLTALYVFPRQQRRRRLSAKYQFRWLGAAGGILALLGMMAAPITTSDTACARLA